MLERIAYFAVAVLVAGLGGFFGYLSGYDAGADKVQTAWDADKATRTGAATVINDQAKAAEPIIVERVVEVERIVRIKGETITKEIPVYVTPEANSACTVPLGFVSVYDRANGAPEDAQGNAARDADPTSASSADAVPQPPEWINEPSGVRLTDIAGVNSINAGAYHTLAARHAGLVEWTAKTCYLPDIGGVSRD